MDGGWADYKRSLSGFSSFDSGISTLKDKAVADKTKVFEMDKLNLGEEAQTVGNIKNTLDTVGESAGGLATTMLSVRSFGAMKKHLKNISDKIGGKESKEAPGEKNSTAENEAPTEEEANPTGDSPEGVRSIQSGGEGDVAPRAQDVDVPEQPEVPSGQEIEMTDMRPQEMEMTDMSEPSDIGGNVATDAEDGVRQLGQNTFHESVADDPSSSAPFTRTPEDTLGTQTESSVADSTADATADATGDAVADAAGDAAATAAADVAADTAVGLGAQVLDAIPIVGEIIGAVVGIGAAIAGGIEAGKEASDEEKEDDDSKAELSISGAQSVANKYGNSVTPTLTSLAQMPSNAGVF